MSVYVGVPLPAFKYPSDSCMSAWTIILHHLDSGAPDCAGNRTFQVSPNPYRSVRSVCVPDSAFLATSRDIECDPLHVTVAQRVAGDRTSSSARTRSGMEQELPLIFAATFPLVSLAQDPAVGGCARLELFQGTCSHGF